MQFLAKRGLDLSLARPYLFEAAADLSSRQGEMVLKGIIQGDTPGAILEAVQKAEGRNLERGRAKIYAALSGGLTKPEAATAGMLAGTLSFYRQSIESLEKLLEERMLKLGQESRLLFLETIPGVTRPMAMTVWAELSCDISRFPTPSGLANWARLNPNDWPPPGGRSQAAASDDSLRYQYLKEALREIAVAASKTTRYFQERHADMLPRLGLERTIAANSAKLLKIMWHLISKNVPFQDNPEEYDQV